jgi:hypothetical protein
MTTAAPSTVLVTIQSVFSRGRSLGSVGRGVARDAGHWGGCAGVAAGCGWWSGR